jgi:undecaprenyl-diphosphatase
VIWKRYGVFFMTFGAVAIADILANRLKPVFDTERPSSQYAEPRPLVHAPTDGSFPSGHAATSFAAATVLTYAWPRWWPAFLLLALGIGFSRVYVGVHYPLDVVGGAVLGILVATALRWLVGALQSSRAARRSAR